MLERDLQHYLFENPDVLFPAQTISRKQKEVFIEGRASTSSLRLMEYSTSSS